MSKRLIEGVKLGIAMEEKGLYFYGQCVKEKLDYPLNELFEFLVREETKHHKLLMKILDELEREKEYKFTIEEYLGKKDKIPNFKIKEIKPLVDKPSVIRTLNKAIQFEEKGLNFYENLESEEKNSEIKALFKRLAQDELDHRETIIKMGRSFF
jgi:rubrerythrin